MLKIHLKNLYDCINRIANDHQKKGIDRSEWFYTDKEFEKIKRDKKNRII